MANNMLCDHCRIKVNHFVKISLKVIYFFIFASIAALFWLTNTQGFITIFLPSLCYIFALFKVGKHISKNSKISKKAKIFFNISLLSFAVASTSVVIYALANRSITHLMLYLNLNDWNAENYNGSIINKFAFMFFMASALINLTFGLVAKKRGL